MIKQKLERVEKAVKNLTDCRAGALAGAHRPKKLLTIMIPATPAADFNAHPSLRVQQPYGHCPVIKGTGPGTVLVLQEYNIGARGGRD